jgi:hypothetical protein
MGLEKINNRIKNLDRKFHKFDNQVCINGLKKVYRVNKQIHQINRQIEKSLKPKMKIAPAVLAVLLIAFVSAGLFFGAQFVGYVIQGEETTTYTQKLDFLVLKDQYYTWNLEQYPEEQFNLVSVSLTGQVVGEGTFTVYLEDDQYRKYLIIYHEAVESEGLSGITGYAVLNESIVEETNETIAEPENLTEEENITTEPDNLTEELESENVTTEQINESVYESNETIIQPENLTEEENITTEPIVEENVTNETAPERARRIDFEDICVETCMLPAGLNSTSYRLVFEMEDVILELESIKYEVRETQPENITDEVTVDVVIRDANNDEVEADVSFADQETDITVTEFREGSGKGKKLNLTKGKYKVNIKPKNHPIKEIELNDVDVDSNITEFLQIDDVPEFGGYIEVYAIDPTNINFTEATVTVTAKGRVLYKCKDWHFEDQLCSGDWVELMNITPGEEYSFILTPDDPAFGEDPVSNATADDCYDEAGAAACTPTDIANIASNASGNIVFNKNTNTILRVSFQNESATINQIINCTVHVDGVDSDGNTWTLQVGNWSTATWDNAGTGKIAPATEGELRWDCTSHFDAGIDDVLFDDLAIRISTNDASGPATAYLDWIYVVINYTLADATPPAIALNYPDDNFTTKETTINFNWTATDDFDSSLLCNLTINGVVNATNVTSPNGTATNYSVSGFSDGTHYWNVTCWDDLNNTNTSETRNFTVDATAPAIALNYPEDNFTTGETSINFNWTATDNFDSSLLCNLTINGVVNATGVASPNGTATNYSVSGFGNGVYYWNVTCWDDSSNSNTSETRNFTVDITAPSIALNYPDDNLTTKETTINFNWTAINGIDPVLDCNLTINGVVNVSGVASPNGTATNYSVSGFNDGTHYWNVTCWDDVNNTNTSETRNFTVDTTPPNVTLNYPPPNYYNDSSDPVNVIFNCSVTDNHDLNNISLYITNSTNQSFSLNQTTDISGVNISANWTLALSNGNYTWNCLAYDVAGNNDWGDANRSIMINYTPPDYPPYWTDNRTNIVLTYSPVTLSYFNISWHDDNGVSSVWFESNYSGSPQNYSMNLIDGNSTNGTYNYSAVLPTGSHYWKSYANDTADQWNFTPAWNFTIAKVTSSCSLTFDPLSPQTYNTSVNASCSCNNLEAGYTLWRNGVNVTAAENNQFVVLAAGNHSYVCNVTETQNYTAATNTSTYEMLPATTVLTLTADPSWNETYPEQTTVNCSANNAQVTPLLYVNSTNVGIPYTITHAAGTYNYTCNATATQNYTSAVTSDILYINRNTSTCSLTFDPLSPQSYGTAVNASCACTNAEAAPTLWRDGVNVTAAENNQFITLAAANYTYVCNVSETQNYTAASNTSDYEIQRATTILTLAASPSWNVTYQTQTDVDCTPNNVEVIPLIYVNSSNVSNPYITIHAAGSYNYTCNATASQNYTSAETSNILSVNKNTSACSLTFDPLSPQTYNTSVNASCACTNPEAASTLWRNSLNVTAAENNQFVVLAAGNHTYVCNVSETQNYTSATNTSTYEMLPATTVLTLTADPSWNATYPNQTTVNCSANNNEVTPLLYVNDTNVGIPYTTTHAAGTYNYTCNATATQNYTSAVTSDILTINKGASLINLVVNSTDGDITIEAGSTITIIASMVIPNTGYVEIYRDGALIANGSSPQNIQETFNGTGLFNITAYYPETQNYTSSYETHFVTVNDTTPPYYSNDQDDSSGTVFGGTIVNVTVYWVDNTVLDTAIFRTNETGTWVNVSTCALSGNTSWCNKTIDTTGDEGKTICWNQYANDTLGNINNTMPPHCFDVIAADLIAPTIYQISPGDNAVDGDGDIYFICNATEGIGLSNVSLYINNTFNQTVNASGNVYTTNFSLLNISDGVYLTWYCKAYDTSDNWNVTGNWTVYVNRTQVPTSTNFTGETTDWASVPDLSNVCNGTAIIDDPSEGKIKWWDCVNATNQNFNQNINVGYNFIEIIFGLHSSFNSSAELVIRNLTWDAPPLVFKDGVWCNETCSNVSYNETTGLAVFNVTHFTNYTTQGNAQLEIWDETDAGMPYANQQKYSNEQMDFFANYTRKNNGQPILGANCTINFTDSDNVMVYNATKQLYEYNRSFATPGIKLYNVTCAAGGFQTITLGDSANISTDNPPYWTDNRTSIVAVYSPVILSYFNITWHDDFGVSSVWFESNYSGSPQNYSMNLIDGNSTNGTYNYSAVLPAGSHYWKSYANDTADQWNFTTTWNFTIARATTVLTLNASPSWNETYPEQTTVNCSADNAVVTPLLYVNDTNVGIPYTTTHAAGTYNYTCNATGNQNYTSAVTSDILTMNKNTSTCSLTFDPASPQNYSTSVNASCACTNLEAGYTLWRNSVNVTATENNLYISLAAGNHTYVCNVSETQNYTSATNTSTYEITPATTVLTLTADPSWNETYPTQTTVNCSANNAEVTPLLYVNGSNVGIPYTTIHAAGTYNYTCNATATQNYTSAETSNILTINKGAGVIYLYLNGSRANFTTYNNSNVNISSVLINGSGNIQVYNNGTLIYNGSSPSENITLFDILGLYNITSVYLGNVNYTADSETWWVNVIPVPVDLPPTVTLSLPPDNYYNDTSDPVNVTFECNATDDYDLVNLSLYITNSSNQSFALNQTVSTTGTFNSTEWVLSLDNGNYTWNCLAYDNASQSDWGDNNRSIRINFTLPDNVPYWSNNRTSIVPVYSPLTLSYFNITWSDDYGVSSVWFESNHSGSPQNYSMNLIAGNATNGTYNYSAVLPAGSHYWKSYANDTADQWNFTNTWDFTIAKVTTVLTLTADPSWNETYPEQTTVNCSANNAEVTPLLYVNDTNVGIPYTTTHAAGTYNYTCNATATQNYTSAVTSDILTINRNTSACSLTFDPLSPQNYGTNVNASCTCNNPEAGYTLWRNSVNVTATENNQFVALPGGNHSYVCNVTETQNYTAASDSFIYTVNKAASLIYLYLNGTRADFTIQVNSNVNITAVLITGQGNIQVYNNGTLIYSGASPSENITLFNTVGLYNITAAYSGNENYTGDSETWYVNVTPLPPDLIPPTINNISFNPDTKMILAGNDIEIIINATDNVGVDTEYISITLPNSTVVQYNLPVNYTTPITGLYDFTIFVNDTSGNTVTSTGAFLAGTTLVFQQYNLVDEAGGIAGTVNVYYPAGFVFIHNSTFTGSYVDEHLTDFLLDYGYIPSNAVARVILRGINVSVDTNETLGYQEVSPPAASYLSTIGINSTYTTMTSATVVYSYSNLSYTNENNLNVYKCDNWNFTGKTCLGNWTDITSQAVQDTANDYFEFNVTSFSGFSIGEVAVPTVAPSPRPGATTPGCVYNWACTEWEPETCPERGVQRRTCTNLGTCEGTVGAPDEIRRCEYITPVLSIDLAVTKLVYEGEKISLFVYMDTAADVKTEVLLSYTVLDKNNNVVYEEEETKVFERSLSFSREIDTSSLEAGDYTFLLRAVYDTEYMTKTALFSVEEIEEIPEEEVPLPVEIEPLKLIYKIALFMIMLFLVVFTYYIVEKKKIMLFVREKKKAYPAVVEAELKWFKRLKRRVNTAVNAMLKWLAGFKKDLYTSFKVLLMWLVLVMETIYLVFVGVFEWLVKLKGKVNPAVKALSKWFVKEKKEIYPRVVKAEVKFKKQIKPVVKAELKWFAGLKKKIYLGFKAMSKWFVKEKKGVYPLVAEAELRWLADLKKGLYLGFDAVLKLLVKLKSKIYDDFKVVSKWFVKEKKEIYPRVVKAELKLKKQVYPVVKAELKWFAGLKNRFYPRFKAFLNRLVKSAKKLYHDIVKAILKWRW